MKENDDKVDEQPSTHKRKMQLYLVALFGVTMLFLLVATIYNIATRERRKSDIEVTKGDENFSRQGASENRDFSALLTQQTNADSNGSKGPVDANSTVPAGVIPYKMGQPTPVEQDKKIEMLQEQVNELVQYLKYKESVEKNGKTGNNGSNQDPVTQFKMAEEIKSLQGRDTAFNETKLSDFSSGLNQNLDNEQDEKDSLSTWKTDPNNIDERRKEVREKIEKSQALSRQSMSENKERSAKIEGARSQYKNAKSSSGNDDEAVDKGGFSKAPKNIVGYSKENSYDADVSGKMSIPAGTVIPFVSNWKSISDYKGAPVNGTIDHDVYDASGQYVLIPKGSTIQMHPFSASSQNEILDSRLGFKPTWVIRPDKKKIDLSKASGLDREGVAAVSGKVDRHILAQISGVVAYAMVGSKSSRTGTGDGQTSYSGDVGEGLRDQAKPIAEKYLNVVPTVTVDGGISMRLVLEDDIYIEPFRDTYSKYY